MTTELEQRLAEPSRENLPSSSMALLSKLQAILRGDRDRALADDPDLFFMDTAELRLLLERLSA